MDLTCATKISFEALVKVPLSQRKQLGNCHVTFQQRLSFHKFLKIHSPLYCWLPIILFLVNPKQIAFWQSLSKYSATFSRGFQDLRNKSRCSIVLQHSNEVHRIVKFDLAWKWSLKNVSYLLYSQLKWVLYTHKDKSGNTL